MALADNSTLPFALIWPPICQMVSANLGLLWELVLERATSSQGAIFTSKSILKPLQNPMLWFKVMPLGSEAMPDAFGMKRNTTQTMRTYS